MFTHIPELIHGIDVAATSTADNAFPVAISVVTFDVATLQMFGCVSVFAKHDDEEAKKHFHFSDSTKSWWEGGQQNSPSKLAYELTFKAEHSVIIPEALNTISSYLNQWKKANSTIATKTPAFDSTILLNAFKICNVPASSLGYPTLIENAHTALRSMQFMRMEPNLANEAKIWTKGRSVIEQYAPHEAGEAGYVTARFYHLLYLNSIDPNLAMEAHKLMVDGKYNFAEFKTQHKEKFEV